MAGTLGVPTLEYAPYYFFGFLSPLVLLFMGVTGWQMSIGPSRQRRPARGPVVPDR